MSHAVTMRCVLVSVTLALAAGGLFLQTRPRGQPQLPPVLTAVGPGTGDATSATTAPSRAPDAAPTSATGSGGTAVAENLTNPIVRKGDCYYQLAAAPGSLCVSHGQITLYNAPADVDGVRVGLCPFGPKNLGASNAFFVYDARRGAPPEGAVVERRRTVFVQLTHDKHVFHVIRDTLSNVEDMLTEAGRAAEEAVRMYVLPRWLGDRERGREARVFPLFLGVTGGAPGGALDDAVTRIADIPDGITHCITGDVWFGEPWNWFTGPPGRLVEYKRRALRALGLPQGIHPAAGDSGEGIPLMLVERYSAKDRKEGKPEVNRKLGNADDIAAVARRHGFAPFTYIFQEHTAVEQLAAATRTRVMVGTHGQGLMWLMFMPDWSVLVEVLLWKEPARGDYPLAAKWSHVHWLRVGLTSPHEVHFPTRPNMTADEKFNVSYGGGGTGDPWLRTYMVVTPNITTVEARLVEATALLDVREYRELPL